MVINAGHEEKDLPHLQKYMKEFVAAGGDVSMETLPDNGILALQGPKAPEVLQRLVKDDLNQMAFMSAKPLTVDGIDCFVSRSGYTGEDGFEIAVPKGSGAEHQVPAEGLDFPRRRWHARGARNAAASATPRPAIASLPSLPPFLPPSLPASFPPSLPASTLLEDPPEVLHF